MNAILKKYENLLNKLHKERIFTIYDSDTDGYWFEECCDN